MDSGSQLQYSGTGTAVTVDSVIFGTFNFNVFRIQGSRPTDWVNGSDTSSIGVKLRNCRGISITVDRSFGFYTGLQLFGDGAGVNFNTIYPMEINESKLGISYQTANKGWVTQNTIIGGQIHLDITPLQAGSRYLDFCDGDTTTVIGTDLEGRLVEESIHICGGVNNIIGTRHEAGLANSIHLTSTSANNLLVNLYGIGSSPDLVLDEGVQNMVLASRYISGTGTATHPGLTLQQIVDDTAALVRLKSIAGRATMELTSQGNIKTLSSSGSQTSLWSNANELLTVGSGTKPARVRIQGTAPTLEVSGSTSPNIHIATNGASSTYTATAGSTVMKMQSLPGSGSVGTESNDALWFKQNNIARGFVSTSGTFYWGASGRQAAITSAGVVSAGTPGANIPTWAQYSLVKISNGTNGCANATGCWQVNGTYVADASAALRQDVALFTLPKNGYVDGLRLNTRTACTGPATALLGVGTTEDSTYFYAATYDVEAAVAATNFRDALSALGSTTIDATQIRAHLVTTGGNVDQLADGCSVNIWLKWSQLP
jgi:hypothetical protein